MVVLLGDDRSSGFVQKVNESNRQFNTYGLVFGVVLYNLYIFVDMTLVPEIIWLDFVVRLFVITPLLFLYFPARYYATRARPDAIAHEVLHGLGCMLVVASLMFIYANARTSAASEYYMGIITVVLYMNTIHRKPFPLAVMGTVGCMVVFIVGLEYVTVTSEVAKMPAIMCSVGVGVVSLFAAYRIENVERRDYLASVREKTLLQRIQNANRELQQLSNTDQLTGIRNRRSFDEAAGEASDNGGRPRALILLDVDYFKNYNDSEGHVAVTIVCAGLPADCGERYARTTTTEVSSRAMAARNLWSCSTIAPSPQLSPSVKGCGWLCPTRPYPTRAARTGWQS